MDDEFDAVWALVRGELTKIRAPLLAVVVDDVSDRVAPQGTSRVSGKENSAVLPPKKRELTGTMTGGVDGGVLCRGEATGLPPL